MSRPSRNSRESEIVAVQRTFFATSSAYGRKQILQSDRMGELLVSTLLRYRDAKKFQLHDFVVMPNHIHVLLTVGPELTVEKAMQLIKGGSSFRAKKELEINSEIWQAGFSEERAFGVEAFDGFRRYIRQNPVKRGLVMQAEEYAYSSANPRFELDPMPEYLRG
ncbi:MAG TPA: transposase [Terriglobales bacterium]|nr:transposase [Terriglobales bacterium]